jgi:hypothetical protein
MSSKRRLMARFVGVTSTGSAFFVQVTVLGTGTSFSNCPLNLDPTGVQTSLIVV